MLSFIVRYCTVVYKPAYCACLHLKNFCCLLNQYWTMPIYAEAELFFHFIQ